MEIGLFGGTFDPIHYAHVELAERIRSLLGLDEVWFLVTPQNPWKRDHHLSPDDDRLAMARLALCGHDGLVASDYEFHLPKPSFSYQTLRRLRADYPDTVFTLIIGGDNWRQFDKWAEHDEILANHPVAVFPRKGDGDERDEASLLLFCPQEGGYNDSLEPHARYDGVPLLPVSSTQVRDLVARGSDVSALVGNDVAAYINDHNLYQ